MPTCRAAIVPAARRPAGSRPASARPVSPGRVSAMPMPISACGASVQYGSAPGSSPRPGEPAGERDRPGGHARRGVLDAARQLPRQHRRHRDRRHDQRGLQRRPRPALGQHDHEQEQRARQARRQQRERHLRRPAAAAARRRARASARGGRIAAATARTTGTCTMKIDCQLISCVSRPPAAGPTAMPIRPAVPHAAAAARCEPRLRASNSIAARDHARAGNALHAAADDQHRDRGRERAQQRRGREAEQPDAPHRAARVALRPVARRAAGSTATASARLNAVNTHETPSTVVSNRRRISGSASVTTDESASTSPTVPAHTSSRPRPARRWAPGSSVAAGITGRSRNPIRTDPTRTGERGSTDQSSVHPIPRCEERETTRRRARDAAPGVRERAGAPDLQSTTHVV